MNKKGSLFVFSGPSGVGKGTIMRNFIATDPNSFISVSATTRRPRPGEEDGVHYYFMTESEFVRLAESGGMLEYANFSGNYYGTPKGPVYEKLEEGKNVFLEIEVQGAAKIKQLCPEAIFIFVMPPDMHELTRRLVDRNTEDQHTIEVRLSNAKREIEQAKNYDYIIVNHTIEEAVNDLTAIVRSAKCTYDHMKNFINEVLNDA